MERDLEILHDNNGRRISTHTLTWSVTTRISYNTFKKIISTHTLTWSVTLLPLFLMVLMI